MSLNKTVIGAFQNALDTPIVHISIDNLRYVIRCSAHHRVWKYTTNYSPKEDGQTRTDTILPDECVL